MSEYPRDRYRVREDLGRIASLGHRKTQFSLQFGVTP
jgi:hypothetical protein